MKITRLILRLILPVCILFSCNKEEAEKRVSKTELITAGPWKRTALVSEPAYDWNANGVSDVDFLKIMFACEKDNLDIYKTNGMIETNEGPTKCNSTDPQSWTVTWAFANNETTLIFDGVDKYTLLELTNTTLKFKSTFEEDGVTYTQVETYGH
jgi:hypothetical protein